MQSHDEESEQALLGTILMTEGAGFDRVSGIIGSQDFFIPRHTYIWDAIKHLYDTQTDIDFITVSDRLSAMAKLQDAGGDSYLTHLLTMGITDSHAETYANIIKGYSIKRVMFNTLRDSMTTLASTDISPQEALYKAISDLQAIELPSAKINTKKRLIEWIEEKTNMWSNPEMLNGISWGLPAFDRAFGLLRPSQFIGIAGQAKGGKSLFIAHAMLRWLRAGIPCALATLEMGDFEIFDRLEEMVTGVDFEDARINKRTPATWKRITTAWTELHSLPMVVDDQPLKMDSLISRFSNWQKELGVKPQIVIVDYAGLIEPSESEKRRAHWERMNDISVALKRFAIANNVIVVSAFQLNREGFGTQKPTMKEIGGSVGNVQNVNQLIGIYRPDETNPNAVAIHHMANRSHETGQTVFMIQNGVGLFLTQPNP